MPASTFKVLIELPAKTLHFPSSNNRVGDITTASQGNRKYSGDSLRLFTTDFLWRYGFRFLLRCDEGGKPRKGSLVKSCQLSKTLGDERGEEVKNKAAMSSPIRR